MNSLETIPIAGKSGKVRVAVVGAGAMANAVHYPSLASFDDVEIAGICDMDAERRNATADRFGIEKRYDDYRRMVAEVSPDGVYVIGPPHLMYDIWTWCLGQGLNLYIEKPMGVTIHQARMLSWLADQKGNVTQVSHQRRNCPLLVKMRNACLQRGPIVHAVCEFYKYDIEPALFAPSHMMDDCTHSVDTLRWICGGEVVKIESHCRSIGVPDINWIGATLHFESGAVGYLVNSWCTGRRVFRVEMHAPGIYADADPESEARLYAQGDTKGEYFDTREVAGCDEFFVFGGFQAKHREFIDSIKSGTDTTSSPFRDCLKTMEIAEKILAQALLES